MNEIGLHKDELDTPSLWVDLDLMEQNIQALATHFREAGVNWRPHTKGIKIPAIAHKAINAGAIGVTCAKLAEAEVMAHAGIHDILIANQVVGRKKIIRLVSLLHHADVKVAVDSEINVRELGEIASQSDVKIGVLIEVNTGMNRAGVEPGEPTLQLARLISKTPGLRFKGLMAWEGHTLVHDDPEVKHQEIEKSIHTLHETVELCRSDRLEVEIVSGGGSGTYTITSHQPGITEIQAGGAIFCDVAYQKWRVRTTPSIFVRVTVTSRPTPNRIIIDAGFKSLPAWIFQPRPVGVEGIARMAMSAEHGIIHLEQPNTTLQVGDTLDVMIAYSDSTVFLYDQLYGIRNDVVEVVWEIQGRGKLR